uniref:Uncharacterized protein n=1 Tax=Anguilla anguilla TaxID=7936 RepID=A0A0E9ST91_ANGAN
MCKCASVQMSRGSASNSASVLFSIKHINSTYWDEGDMESFSPPNRCLVTTA